MKVQIEDVSPIEKRLSFEVESAFVEKELTAAYLNLSQQVKHPGFRAGKVPRRILEQKYKAEVEADVVKRVQLLSFIDAVREHKVAAVGEPQMLGGKIHNAQPFVFSARVEVKPVLVPTEYKTINLKKFDTSVGDDKIDEQLQKMRESRSTLEAAAHETAKAFDFAVIDFDATKDGQPFQGNTGRQVTVELKPGELIEGNLAALEGMKLGETKDVEYTFPGDYRIQEVAGAKTLFKCTLKELKFKKLPELNDEFAKVMGTDSLSALKTKMRTDLERAAKNRVESEEREELFKKLIEKNDFVAPTALVNRAIDMMLDNALQSMARSGVDPRMLQLDWSKLREDLRPRAEIEIKGQLLLESIGQAEKLVVGEGDVQAKLEALATEYQMPLEKLKQRYTGEALEGLANRLREEKAYQFVKSHAKLE
jgi:trigger factor